jgi:hypothetical protein
VLAAAMALEIAILGSVEPRINGNPVGVPAGKQRALFTFACLLWRPLARLAFGDRER